MSSVNPNVQLDDGTVAGAPVLKWGAAAVAVAGLVDVYGVYGDAHPKADQKAGLPFVLIVAVIAAVVVFGVVVPVPATTPPPFGVAPTGVGSYPSTRSPAGPRRRPAT